jgi:hypothetical protein
MLKTLFTVFALLIAVSAFAAEPVLSLYAGANGIWFDEKARPSDFEGGITASASFSPHIAGVGAAFYGFDNSYVRATLGPRITVTDANNKNFSVGVGLEYNACTEPVIRPQEWQGTVSLGWVPYPNTMPRWVVGAQGSLGLSTNEPFGMLAVRYRLGQ